MPNPEISRIEIKGLAATWYDFLLGMATLGRYGRLMDTVVSSLHIKPGEVIADFGAGTGANMTRMLTGPNTPERIYGIDIGHEMVTRMRNRFRKTPRVQVLQSGITEPLTLPEKADRVFMSFVLHGFEPQEQDAIVRNVGDNLRPGGEFDLLDWNEFDPEKSPAWIRWAFFTLECPIAREFIKTDWKRYFEERGFSVKGETFFFRHHIRLLKLVT